MARASTELNTRQSNTKHQVLVYVVAVVFILSVCSTVEAVREGSANANMMIRRYERKQEFGKAALWREAAARCFDIISTPMTQITLEYCERTTNQECIAQLRKELDDIRRQREAHLKLASELWTKAGSDEQGLETERGKIDQFIAEWVGHYPPRFYDFGTYHHLFTERIQSLRAEGKHGKALRLEAEASDICARQYERIPVQYFTVEAREAKESGNVRLAEQAATQTAAYRSIRDKHLKRSALLRSLAQRNPAHWPSEADDRNFRPPPVTHKISAQKAIQAARSNATVSQLLDKHKSAREFAWFQGFCWTVSYYSRDWGSLAIVFVDDNTAKVFDMLLSPGDLEEHGEDKDTDEAENTEADGEDALDGLKLAPQQAADIVRKHARVQHYLQSHPEVKFYASYSGQYRCWLVEIVLDRREVGLVTVSDVTGKVLEVDLPEGVGE